jgi:pectin lyase
MRFELVALLVAATSASAQKVVGTAYGFGAGATGGGSAAAVTPTTNDELAKLLSDDVARTILITKEFDFTGKTATGAGCDRKSCSAKSGGQFYLGDLSCAPSDDNVAVSSITYDTAGTTALAVGSNKSILGVGGKGVIKGKGLSIKKNASNVIMQGVHITTINPGVVWGGDALDMQGGNTKIWIDHCKFSLIGRMFIVSHYDGASATLSNNEFDGVTTTSASCK